MQHQHDPNYKAWKQDWQFLLAAIRGSSYYKLPKIFNFLEILVIIISSFAPKVPFYKLEKCCKDNPIFQKHVATITLLVV
jgi:omega-6 fatty acid desaturase (delta-12 desaturase)